MHRPQTARPKPDYTWEALLHPEKRPVFAAREGVAPFDPSATGLSLANAWWLSNASHLAYFEAGDIERELPNAGLELVEYFSAKSTQAYIAVGNRYALLAFRGTEPDDLADVLRDADAFFRPLRGIGERRFEWAGLAHGARVHRGFLTALDEVWSKVDHWLARLSAEGNLLWYTGHSLGAALATLAAARRAPAAIYTFGSPAVGDDAFARLVAGIPVQRIANTCDVVTMVPPAALGYRHVGRHRFITATGAFCTDPDPAAVRRYRASALLRYALKLPWLRPGMVKSRFLADHSIVNYTAAIAGRLPTPG